MGTTTMRVMAVAAFVMMAGVSAAAEEKAEMVGNPSYAAWKKAKVGTIVEWTTVGEVTTPHGKRTMTNRTILTLKSVDENGATLGCKMVMGDREIELDDTVVPPLVEKSKAMLAYATKPLENLTVKNVKQGKAAIEVAGAKYDAVTYTLEMTLAQGGQTTSGDVSLWVSDKVPGGLLKMVTVMKGESKSTLTVELAAVKTGK